MAEETDLHIRLLADNDASRAIEALRRDIEQLRRALQRLGRTGDLYRMAGNRRYAGVLGPLAGMADSKEGAKAFRQAYANIQSLDRLAATGNKWIEARTRERLALRRKGTMAEMAALAREGRLVQGAVKREGRRVERAYWSSALAGTRPLSSSALRQRLNQSALGAPASAIRARARSQVKGLNQFGPPRPSRGVIRSASQFGPAASGLILSPAQQRAFRSQLRQTTSLMNQAARQQNAGAASSLNQRLRDLRYLSSLQLAEQRRLAREEQRIQRERLARQREFTRSMRRAARAPVQAYRQFQSPYLGSPAFYTGVATAVGTAAVVNVLQERIEADFAEFRMRVFGDLSQEMVEHYRSAASAAAPIDPRVTRNVRGFEGLDRMAVTFGMNQAEAMNAFTDTLKAGIPENIAPEFTMAATRLSYALDAELGQATRVMARLANIGRGPGEAISIADIERDANQIAIAAAFTAADPNEIISALRRGGGALAATTMTVGELSAFTGAGITAGIQPFRVGTFMDFLTSDLANAAVTGGQRGEDLARGLRMAGMGNVRSFSREFVENPTEMLVEILQNMGDMDYSERAEVADLIGMREWRGEFLQLVDIREHLIDVLAEVADPGNADFVMKMAEERIGTMRGLWLSMTAAFSLIREEIGKGLEPAFREITRFFIDHATLWRDLRIADLARAMVEGVVEALHVDYWGDSSISGLLGSLFGDLRITDETIDTVRDFVRGFVEGFTGVFKTIWDFVKPILESIFGDLTPERLGQLAGGFIALTMALVMLQPVISTLTALSTLLIGLALSGKSIAGLLGGTAAGAGIGALLRGGVQKIAPFAARAGGVGLLASLIVMSLQEAADAISINPDDAPLRPLPGEPSLLDIPDQFHPNRPDSSLVPNLSPLTNPLGLFDWMGGSNGQDVTPPGPQSWLDRLTSTPTAYSRLPGDEDFYTADRPADRMFAAMLNVERALDDLPELLVRSFAGGAASLGGVLGGGGGPLGRSSFIGGGPFSVGTAGAPFTVGGDVSASSFSAGVTPLSGQQGVQAQQLFQMLKADGWSDVQAAGLVGHMLTESSLNPTAYNASEGAFGLLQWRNDRLANLRQFAASRGLDYRSVEAQAKFVRWEMENIPYEQRQSGAFRGLGANATVDQAVGALTPYIRHAAGARGHESQRYANARGVLAGARSGTAVQASSTQIASAVDLAGSLLGAHERGDNAPINQFLRRGGVNIDAARTAWCAGFVNSALAQVGVTGTGSLVANSFRRWGEAVDPANVTRGDVLVQHRNRGLGTGGHVGFATGNTRMGDNGELELEMLSGNSSDQVRRTWHTASSLDVRRALQSPAAEQIAAGTLQQQQNLAATLPIPPRRPDASEIATGAQASAPVPWLDHFRPGYGGPVTINVNGANQDPESIAGAVQRRLEGQLNVRTHDLEHDVM